MGPDNRKKISKTALIVLLVICITVLHYRTDEMQLSSHILFREFYFLPIILAGFWFGMLGALGVSFSVSLLYLPYILSLPEGMTGHNLGNIAQVVLFNVIGLVVGWLRDREAREQRKSLEAENLAAMGRAVSSIAHDMKTPLMAIGGFVQQVRRKVEEKGMTKKLDLAAEQVRRLEVLVGDMLAFARPLRLQCSRGKVAELLEEIVVIAEEKAAGHGVSIRVDLEKDMPLIEYDPHRLQQAVLNLVNNAVEASPSGGEVTIRCGCGADQANIEIIDLGEGIPTDRLQEIFAPFVTTKREGTGLGLSIVKKVVEAHAGTIGVERQGGRETVFRISLPFSSHEKAPK